MDRSPAGGEDHCLALRRHQRLAPALPPRALLHHQERAAGIIECPAGRGTPRLQREPQLAVEVLVQAVCARRRHRPAAAASAGPALRLSSGQARRRSRPASPPAGRGARPSVAPPAAAVARTPGAAHRPRAAAARRNNGNGPHRSRSAASRSWCGTGAPGRTARRGARHSAGSSITGVRPKPRSSSALSIAGQSSPFTRSGAAAARRSSGSTADGVPAADGSGRLGMAAIPRRDGAARDACRGSLTPGTRPGAHPVSDRRGRRDRPCPPPASGHLPGRAGGGTGSPAGACSALDVLDVDDLVALRAGGGWSLRPYRRPPCRSASATAAR